MVKDLSFNDITIQLGWYLSVSVKRHTHNISYNRSICLDLENNLRVVKSHLTINVHKKQTNKNSNKNLNEAWFYIADNRRLYC